MRVGLRPKTGEPACVLLNIRFYVCLLLLSMPWATFGSEPENEPLLAVVEQGREAIRQWDYPAMTNAAAKVSAMEVNDGASCFWRDYWAGTLWFHAVLFQNEAPSRGDERSESAFLHSSAMTALKKSIQVRPDRSDAHAMLGVLCGIQIQDHPVTAMWNGPKLMGHMKKALAYGNGNPQTAYLIGVSTLKRAGSDPVEIERANAYFMQALEAYELQQSQSLSPWEATWGHDHTLMFLGRAADQRGDPVAAAGWYDKAVALNPHLTRTEEGVE